MKNLNPILIMTLLTFSMASQAQAKDLGGYPAFKAFQTFVLGLNNWGSSANGDCRLDFELQPIEVGGSGFASNEAFHVVLNLDKPAGQFSLEFKDIISTDNFRLNQVSANQIVVSGGSYDGDATMTLTKQANGSVVVKAHWDDREGGPNRDGTCVLPSLKK